MTRKRSFPGRRDFLQGATVGGVAAISGIASASAAPPTKPPVSATGQPRAPGIANAWAESLPRNEAAVYESCGGDYMVDVIRGFGIEFLAATPGNTFMGLHESIINYGMLSDPKLTLVTTVHEEASVGMAHGYSKIAGKPMACAMHTAVGLQHGSMAIYNAWCDRVPIFMIVGASLDETRRRSGVDWDHSVQDGASLVRDFTKWDDQPGSLRAWGESAARAFKIAMTPPYGPVLIATDTLMQEEPQPGGAPPPIPQTPRITPPAGEEGALREAAKALIAAENPVIYADRLARTPAGLAQLVELAELLQVPVVDSFNRLNFPWRHPLNQSEQQQALIATADLVLELEPGDPFSLTATRTPNGAQRSVMSAGSKRITISSLDVYMKSNYQDFERYVNDIDLAIAGDAEASLPALIEAVRQNLPENRKSALTDRGARWARAHAAQLDRSRQAAANGWDDRPISTARLCAEIYAQLHGEDWTLASFTEFQSRWPQRLWAADKHSQFIGGSGGYGIGYLGPATLGAALANRKHGRVTVAINGDGDFMMGPGVLWTAAHESIPLLYVVHNNRGYMMETMQMQMVANRRQRGADRVLIGNELSNPNIDFAMLARSLGVYGQGPIDNPADLGPAIRRAIAVVKKGEPALIDVVSQGR